MSLMILFMLGTFNTGYSEASVNIFEEDFETYDLTTRGWSGNLNSGSRWEQAQEAPVRVLWPPAMTVITTALPETCIRL